MNLLNEIINNPLMDLQQVVIAISNIASYQFIEQEQRFWTTNVLWSFEPEDDQ